MGSLGRDCGGQRTQTQSHRKGKTNIRDEKAIKRIERWDRRRKEAWVEIRTRDCRWLKAWVEVGIRLGGHKTTIRSSKV